MQQQKLEERFQDALGRWKEHHRENPFHSFPEPYLDCDAYREIVSMGVSSLPQIRDQLHKEIEADKRYDDELNRLKIKVFGTDQVELFYDNYRKICENEGYLDYQKRRNKEDTDFPGHYWCFAVHEIVDDDFKIEIKEDSPVKPVTQEFVGIDVKGVKQFTLDWLDENIPKYVQTK